ncbi:MAG TPA: rhomboid family intramembrane serine protease [Pyrinomonadaceae bacterium]|nr:rhomboid family intramembrane serine protease [Pyrinomonadaceae bacterium]
MSLQYENEEIPEKQISPEEFLAEQKRAIRKKSFWAIGVGAFLAIISVAGVWLLVSYFPESLEELNLEDKSFLSILFRNILFLLGLFFLGGGIWGLLHAKSLKIEDFISSPEAIAFLESARETKPYYSYILVGSIIAVYLVQLLVDRENPREDNPIAYSIELAGFIKPLFRQGEWWRILTGGALHGGLLHIYFNSQAFYGFGSTIEYVANRAHLAIVFLLAVIGGGVLSLIFMPAGISVGASGGIMGLVGYLAIYGYRRKRQLPPDFLKSMLINIGFIAAFGIIAYRFVDNFAHLGGLIVGAVYGFIQIPRDLNKNPREVGTITEIFGWIALGIFIYTCIFSVLLLLKVVS